VIIALVNQKGGVGKTTVAVHMAYWLSKKGSAVLVDSDVQQSSSNWLSDLDIPCSVTSDPEELLDLIPELAQQYDAVVVDGPAGQTEITKAILYGCDLALIPCKPSGLDTHSSSKIIRMLKQAQRIRGGMPKAALFLNQAVKGTVLLKESRELLSQTGVPLLPTVIYNRQSISDAPGQGITVWLDSTSPAKGAATDFESLFREALEIVNAKN
jgi:chromosome partitioning protein